MPELEDLGFLPNKKEISKDYESSYKISSPLEDLGFISTPSIGRNEITFAGNVPKLGESIYDKNTLLEDIYDLENIRGQRQPWSAQLGLGLTRLVGTTGTKFMEGLGFVGGLASGDMDYALDNGWVRFWENADNKVKEYLPVYKTRKYIEGNVFDQMFHTTAFWADDVADGLAFMASSLIGSKGLNALGDVAKLGKGTSRALRYAMNAAAKTGLVAEDVVKIKPIVDEMGLLGMGVFNSFNEAGFEARDTQQQVKKEQAQKLFAKDYDTLNDNERFQVDAIAAEAARKTYWNNVVALMPSNYVTNSFFFKPFKASKGRLTSMFKDGKLVEEIEPLTGGALVKEIGKDIGLSWLSEGVYEENIQNAFQNYNKRTAGQDTRFVDDVIGYADEWLKGFTTDEGQKNIVLGGLIGTLGGGVGAYREAKGRAKADQELHDIMQRTLKDVHYKVSDISKIDPETGKIIPGEYDTEKLQQELIAQINSKIKNEGKIDAIKRGDYVSYDLLNSIDFAPVAFEFFGDPDGITHLDNQIDVWAKTQIEQNTKEGQEPNQKEIDALSAKYKSDARKLQKVYDIVTNNITPFFSSKDALESIKKNLTPEQYSVLEKSAGSLQDAWTKSLYMAGARQQFLSRMKSEYTAKMNQEFAEVRDISMKSKEYQDLLSKQAELLNRLSEANTLEESLPIEKEVNDNLKKLRDFKLEGVAQFSEYNYLETQIKRIDQALQQSINDYKNLSDQDRFMEYSKNQLKAELDNIIKQREESSRAKAKEERKTVKDKVKEVVDKVKETITPSPIEEEFAKELEQEELVKEPESKSTDVINDKEYSDFIDKGIVSQDRLNSIADKVKNRETLSNRENEIFNDKTSEINSIISKEKVPTDIESKKQDIERRRKEELTTGRYKELEDDFNKNKLKNNFQTAPALAQLNNLYKEINAKYDAEIAELESYKTPSTEELLKHTSDVVDDNYEDGNNPIKTPEVSEDDIVQENALRDKDKRVDAIGVGYNVHKFKYGKKGKVTTSLEVENPDYLLNSSPMVGETLYLSYDRNPIKVYKYNQDGSPTIDESGEHLKESRTFEEIKSDNPLDVPIKIEAIDKDGKRTLRGYLPTIAWVKSIKGDTPVNIANETEANQNNYKLQVDRITKLREELVRDPNLLDKEFVVTEQGLGRLIKDYTEGNKKISEALPNFISLPIWKGDVQPFTIYNKGFRVGEDELFGGELGVSQEFLDKLSEGNFTGAVFMMIPAANGKFIPTPVHLGKLTTEMSDAIIAALDARVSKDTDVLKELQSKTGIDVATSNGLKDFLKQYLFIASEAFKGSPSRPVIKFSTKESILTVEYNNTTRNIKVNSSKDIANNKEFLKDILSKTNFSVRLSQLNSDIPVNILTYKDGKFGDNTQTYNQHLSGLINTNLRELIDPNGKPVYTVQSVINIDRKSVKETVEPIREGKITPIKEGVNLVFEQNPELSNIGTQEQYSKYLDTIFPDSKVKDIVYHGTNRKFEQFNKEFLATRDAYKNASFLGFYFTTSKSLAEKYLPKIDTDPFGFGEKIIDVENAIIIKAVLNIKNPSEISEETFGNIQSNIKKSDFSNNTDSLSVDNYVFSVFEPEQIHILGSKQDIEGFKKFVESNKSTTEPKVKKTKPVRTSSLLSKVKVETPTESKEVSKDDKLVGDLLIGPNQLEQLRESSKGLLVTDGDYMYSSNKQSEVLDVIRYLVHNAYTDVSRKGNPFYVNRAFENALNELKNHKEVLEYLADSENQVELDEKVNSEPEYVNLKGITLETINRQLEEISRIVKPDVWEQFKKFSAINLQKIGFKISNDQLVDKTPENIVDNESIDEVVDETQGSEGGYERTNFDSGAVFQLDSKNTASSRIKLWLSTLESNEVSSLGLSKFIPLDTAWDDLMEILSPSEISLDSFLNVIKNGYETNPSRGYLKQIYDALTDSSTEFRTKNEFVSVFGKNHQNFNMVIFSKDRNGSISGYVVPSDRNTVTSRIIDQWNENFKESGTVFTKDGSLQVDSKKAQEFKNRMLTFNSKTPVNEMKSFVQELFNFMGITMNQKGFEDTFTILSNLNNSTQKNLNRQLLNRYGISGSLLEQFSYTKQGAPNGVFSILIDPLLKETEEKSFEINNPFSTEGGEKIVKFLASQEGKYSSLMLSKNFRNVEGKTLWSYGYHNYLTLDTRKFIEDEDFRSKLKLNPYSSTALWFNPRFEKKILETLEVSYIDGLREQGLGKTGSTRSDMSERELELDNLIRFMNSGNDAAYIVDLTKSDKSTLTTIKVPRIRTLLNDKTTGLDVTKFKDGRITEESVKSNLLDLYMNLVRGEADRIQKVRELIELESQNHVDDDKGSALDKATKVLEEKYGKQFIEGSKYFYFFEGLNDVVRDADGSINYSLLQGGGLKTLEPIVRKVVVDMYNTTIDNWNKYEFVGEKKNPFHENYIKNYGQNLQGKDLVALVAAEYHMNSFLTTATMMQVIEGDPAAGYKKSVKDTLAEYQKRASKDIAPGALGNNTWMFKDNKGNTWKGNKYYHTVFAKDDTSSNMVEGYAKELGAYNTLAGTDAQELVTLEEFLNNMMSYGRISDRMYSNIMDKIVTAAKNKTYDYELDESEIKLLKDAVTVFQPQKPVQVQPFFTPDGIRMISYIKTSAFPLIPNITKGLGIDELRTAMERDGVGRLAFNTGVKLGSSRSVGIFNEDGNVKQNISFKGSIHQMDRGRFFIQQDIPYDPTKSKIVTISQMNKLLFEGILDYTGFKFLGKEYSGAELKRVKENIRTELFKLEKDKLFNRLGIKEVDGVPTITKESIPKIKQTLEDEAITRGWDINSIKSLQIDDKGNFVIPLAFNSSAAKIESMLLSLFNPIVKQKVSGRSGIQGSPSGFTKSKVKGWTKEKLSKESGIIFTKDYDPETGLKFTNTDIEGTKVLSYCEVLVTPKFTDVAGNSIDLTQYVDKDGYLDTSRIDPELLNLVGARIPNQGHSSQSAIKIVGFLPSYMGDLVIVPKAITKQMGSDFDVDKLYSYMYNYMVGENGNISKVPSAINVSEEDIDVDDNNVKKFIKKMFPTKYDSRSRYYDELTKRKELDRGIAKWFEENFDLDNALESDIEQVDANIRDEVLKDLGLTKEDIYIPSSKQLVKDVLQNAYIDVHWSVLTHPKVMQKALQPLDKPDLAKIKYKEDVKEPFNSPTRQIQDFISQRAGKDGVGVFSRAVVGTTVLQDKDLYLKDEEDNVKYFEGFEGYKLYRISGVGKSEYKKEFRSKVDNLIIQQSAAVDNAKDPLLDKNNLNMATFNASIAISVLSDDKDNGVNVEYNSAFLRQEIIRDYVKEISNLSDSLNETFVKDKTGYVKDLLYTNYLNRLGEKVYNPTNKAFSLKDMENMLDEGNRNSPDYVKSQLEILEHFLYLDSVGRELSDIFSAISTDSKGFGKSLQEVKKKVEQIEGLERKFYIANAHQVLEGETGVIANYVKMVNTTLGQLFPYNEVSVKRITGKLEDLRGISNNRIDLEFRKEVFDDIKSFLFTQGNLGWEWSLKDLTVDTDTNKSLSTLLREFKKNPLTKDNPFIKNLHEKGTTTKGNPSTIEYVASQAERLDNITVTQGFLDLLLSKDDSIREFGEKLVAYTYLTGGIQEAVQFTKYIPTDYLVVKGIGEKVGNFTDIDEDRFIRQFIQHHPNYAAKVQDIESKDTITLNSEKYSNLLRMERNEFTGKLEPVMAKYVSTWDRNKWALYEKINDNGVDATYSKIPLLGSSSIKGVTGFNEFNANQDVTSLFKENRVGDTITITPNRIEAGQGTIESNPTYEKVKVENYIDSTLTGIDTLENTIDNFKESDFKVLGELFSKMSRLLPEDFNIKVDSRLSAVGRYDSHTLYINPKTLKERVKNTDNREVSNRDVEQVLVHELLHAYTSELVQRYDANPNDPKIPEKVKQSLGNLKIIYNFATSALTEDEKVKLKELKSKLKDAKDKGDKFQPTLEDYKLYGFVNGREFISEALTNKEFQERLNAMDISKSKTVFERIKDVVMDIYNAFAKSLGIQVKDNSVLKATIMNTIDLIHRVDNTITKSTYVEDKKSNLEDFIDKLVPNYVKTNADKVRIVAEFKTFNLLSSPSSREDIISFGEQAVKFLKGDLENIPKDAIDNAIVAAVIGDLTKQGLSEEEIWNKLFNQNTIKIGELSPEVSPNTEDLGMTVVELMQKLSKEDRVELRKLIDSGKLKFEC